MEKIRERIIEILRDAERDTLRTFCILGFSIEINWRGFSICRPCKLGQYWTVCLRWWAPGIYRYRSAGMTFNTSK